MKVQKKQTLLIYILIICCIGWSFGQKTRTDLAVGPAFDDQKVAMLVLSKIDLGNPIDFNRWFWKPNQQEITKIKIQASKIFRDYPNRHRGIPSYEYSHSKSEWWFLRTYYEIVGDSVRYDYQIRIDLERNNDTIKVSNFEFREGQRIKRIDKHLLRLKDNSIPPPPPGFLIID